MGQILLYVAIMSLGIFLAKRNLIPEFIKKRLNSLQTFFLFVLLSAMGYKIGIDDTLLSNFHTIGKQSVIFALCTAGGSVLFTYLCFMVLKLFSNKKGEGDK